MKSCRRLRITRQSFVCFSTLTISLAILCVTTNAQNIPNRGRLSTRRLEDIGVTSATSSARSLQSAQSRLALKPHNEEDVRYKAVPLGVLPGYTNSGIANEVNIINNAGHVTGESWISNGDPNNVYLSSHPFLWKDRKLTALPLPKGASAAYATGINDRDQVIAETNEVDSNGVRVRRAFMVDQGKVTVLPALDADSNAQPFAINVWGSAVGLNHNRITGNFTPVVWSGRKIYALPLLPGQDIGIAYGINDLGVIAGYQFPADDSSETACLWYWNGSSYAIIALQTLGGNYGDAFGINNWGQVVGDATDAGDVDQFATLWDVRGVYALPMLPGDTDGMGNAINDFGQITGFTFGVDQFGNDYQRIVLWQNGTVTDLQTVVPSNTPALSNIGNANLLGQIAVATGFAQDGSDNFAYVLIPKDK